MTKAKNKEHVKSRKIINIEIKTKQRISSQNKRRVKEIRELKRLREI